MSNTFSWESPEFQTGFPVSKRSPRHPKECSGKLDKSGDPKIWSLVSFVSGTHILWYVHTLVCMCVYIDLSEYTGTVGVYVCAYTWVDLSMYTHIHTNYVYAHTYKPCIRTMKTVQCMAVCCSTLQCVAVCVVVCVAVCVAVRLQCVTWLLHMCEMTHSTWHLAQGRKEAAAAWELKSKAMAASW